MFEHIKNGTAVDLMNKAQMKRLSIGSYEQRKGSYTVSSATSGGNSWKCNEGGADLLMNCTTNEGKHEIILLYHWSNPENIYIF